MNLYQLKSHSVTYTLNRNTHIVVKYEQDSNTGKFIHPFLFLIQNYRYVPDRQEYRAAYRYGFDRYSARCIGEKWVTDGFTRAINDLAFFLSDSLSKRSTLHRQNIRSGIRRVKSHIFGRKGWVSKIKKFQNKKVAVFKIRRTLAILVKVNFFGL